MSGRYRIVGGVAAELEVPAVRIGRSFDLHPFPDPTLVVVHGRDVGVGRLIAKNQLQRFAPSLQTTIERRVGLRELLGREIRPPEIEMSQPRVE